MQQVDAWPHSGAVVLVRRPLAYLPVTGLPNVPPGLPHHPVPGLRGTTPAYIRTGMPFTILLHRCAEYPCQGGEAALEQALEDLFQAATKAIEDGINILILSDRGVGPGVAPIPALLATSGLHHYLIRHETRTRVALVVESGEPREMHHLSLLIGYGVTAVNPYLAMETLVQMIEDRVLVGVDHDTAAYNYVKAAVKGVVKVMSKMGISTIQSYCGAQIFEAFGLSQRLVYKYFTWTATRVEGIDLPEIYAEIKMRHDRAFPVRLFSQTLVGRHAPSVSENGKGHEVGQLLATGGD